ncbi:O-antigen ligase family protein [Thermodesulfobacteriota bacterium]
MDKFCAVTGSLVPIGLVVGNVGFEAVIGIVGLGWLIRCVLIRENPFRQLLKHPLVIPWMVWFACIVLSLVFNGPGSKGWAHDIVFIRYVLFGLALLDISKRLPVAKYVLYGLAAGVIWAALNTISAYVLGYDFIGKPLTRYTAKLKEASRIAGMTAYAAAFFLAWGLLDDKLSTKSKTMIIGIGLIAFIQLFQTQVRTAVIASAAGAFFCVIFFIRQRKSLWVAVTFLAGVLLAVGLFFHFGRAWDLISFYDRIYYWKVAWYMWLDNPFFGVGISSFQDAYKEMALSGKVAEFIAPDGSVFKLSEVTHAHNLLLMLAASTGLLGMASFCWLLINSVRTIFNKLYGFCLGLTTWPVVFLVIGLTGFNIYHSWYQALLAFWLVLIGSNSAASIKNQFSDLL